MRSLTALLLILVTSIGIKYWYLIPGLLISPFTLLKDKRLAHPRFNPLIKQIKVGMARVDILEKLGEPDSIFGAHEKEWGDIENCYQYNFYWGRTCIIYKNGHVSKINFGYL